ncbi:hypothetical protein FHG87_007660 [Trinorchestia longiramus]|nr:hypothetical protein FHG87_007660 [Trinorchestia longiramus]
MIKQVAKIALEDHRVSVEDIVSNVDISMGSAHTILYEDLKRRKVSSKWIPRILTVDNKVLRAVELLSRG